jgi:hypothetical protein
MVSVLPLNHAPGEFALSAPIDRKAFADPSNTSNSPSLLPSRIGLIEGAGRSCTYERAVLVAGGALDGESPAEDPDHLHEQTVDQVRGALVFGHPCI